MTEPSSQEQTPSPDEGSRIPRLAIVVVALGIVASLAVYGLSFLPGSGSVEVEWDTVEEIQTPAAKDLGKGSFGVARATISTLAPNEDDLLLYRVAGVARIDSGENVPTTVRCDVYSRSDEDTRIARSTKRGAVWPKPSDDLQAQDVPETSFVKYDTEDSNKVDLPIRDVVQRYTDSIASTLVDWLPEYHEDYQTWIWTMKDGTGVGTATLPFVVIFEATGRPKGSITCKADIGRKSAKVTVPFRQDEWPITDDQPNSSDVTSGDATNVE